MEQTITRAAILFLSLAFTLHCAAASPVPRPLSSQQRTKSAAPNDIFLNPFKPNYLLRETPHRNFREVSEDTKQKGQEQYSQILARLLDMLEMRDGRIESNILDPIEKKSRQKRWAHSWRSGKSNYAFPSRHHSGWSRRFRHKISSFFRNTDQSYAVPSDSIASIVIPKGLFDKEILNKHRH